MKKIITIFCILNFYFCHSQLIEEIKKTDLQKVLTKNNEKSLGLDISISYPADWNITAGKRPHMLFNLVNPDRNIRSTIGIADILENATIEDKNLLKNLSEEDIKFAMTQNFPDSKNCSQYFVEIGIENPTNSTCRLTKIEGLNSSVASSFGTMRRAEFTVNSYMVYYQVPFKTFIITISFNFQNVANEQDRFLADNLSNKIMNSLIINNLWKK